MKKYLILVKCTDGITRPVEKESTDPDQAVLDAESDMLYYLGTSISSVEDIREV